MGLLTGLWIRRRRGRDRWSPTYTAIVDRKVGTIYGDPGYLIGAFEELKRNYHHLLHDYSAATGKKWAPPHQHGS